MSIFSETTLWLSSPLMGQTVGVWGLFIAGILGLMIFDLFFMSRKDEVVSPRASLYASLFYFILACLFGAWLWSDMGETHGIDYFTAYTIEMSLSLDNLFVMSIILSYFHIPRKYQHRVLFWGIIGVLVMRGIMIASGLALVESAEWVLFVFAAFLIFTGAKMLVMKGDDEEENLDDSRLIKFFQKHLRYTKELDGHKFFVSLPSKETGRMALHATPLFMALICIEFMDVVFALDSVPAVFAITRESFVVYTSNIFAILGLRSLYFAVVALLDRFKYMSVALSIVLIFIGGKVFYGHFVHEIHPFISLAITLSVLAAGVIYSLYRTRDEGANT